MKYAIYFNKKYPFIGQLMQGRFRSEIIDDDQYFLAINQYIHLNPVKAGMVAHPKEYHWSSFNSYMRGLLPSLVDTAKTLEDRARRPASPSGTVPLMIRQKLQRRA
ncbi:MAG: hypothetical protein M0T74_07290 [Desulfitobacterium hafniense]|nr:hypothetical protein [Desulfitobacterium hafniense]